MPKPVEIILSESDLIQGDLAKITVKNVENIQDIKIESEIDNVNLVATKTKNEFIALVPIGYLDNIGEYKITVSALDKTQDFIVNVSNGEFEVQQMYISQEISNATVNSAAANTEFRNIVHPLYSTFDENIYFEGNFIQPVIARISTPFGVIRYVNDDPVPSRHGGIDIAADKGEPILAPNHGKIEYAGFLQLSGNTIVLDHGAGLKSYFYHMDSLNVQTGDAVTKGDLIGTVGTTGYSTGYHLHYEVKMGRNSVNPWPLFDGTSKIFE